MPPRKRAEPKPAPIEPEIADVPLPKPKNDFSNAGFEFLEEEPEENRTIDRDDKFWNDAKNVLEMAPQRWARVRTFDKVNAASQKAANINGDRNKTFPSDKFEARYSKDTEAGTSTLYLMFKG